MKICAIVLNYRDAARTAACMSSLIGQGLHTVLVIDNSDDAEAVEELAAMVDKQFDHADYNLRLLNPGSNLGFAQGVNFGLNNVAALNFDAYLLINNDAIAMPDMVSRLAIALFDSNAEMVAPIVVDAKGKPLPILWYQRYFGLQTTFPLLGSFPYLSGCCLLVRREMLREGKLLDEDFFMYGEDTLLGWHLACKGMEPLRLNDAYVRHEGEGSSRRGKLFYEYHMARAHILLAKKTWCLSLEIPLQLVCKSLTLLLRALWRSLRFRNVVPLKAFFMAWRSMDIRVP